MGTTNKYTIFRQERRAQIIATAKRLIVANGFGDITMKQLAAELAISRNTLYKYFDSLDKLAYEIQLLTIQNLQSKLTQLPFSQSNGLQIFTAIIDMLFEYIRLNPQDFTYISLFDARYCQRDAAANLHENYLSTINIVAANSIENIINLGVQDGSIFAGISAKDAAAITTNLLLSVCQRFSLIGESGVSESDRKTTESFVKKSIISYLRGNMEE